MPDRRWTDSSTDTSPIHTAPGRVRVRGRERRKAEEEEESRGRGVQQEQEESLGGGVCIYLHTLLRGLYSLKMDLADTQTYTHMQCYSFVFDCMKHNAMMCQVRTLSVSEVTTKAPGKPLPLWPKPIGSSHMNHVFRSLITIKGNCLVSIAGNN